MNERIKELKQQAIDYAWSFRNEKASGCLDNIFQEKFAELIVKECADTISKDSRLNDVRSAANGCVAVLKEHFGQPK